ncbi:MAG TPA: hypothetical protein VMD47_12190 [Candidatus Acidoferrales bacterium]|nr:hypothetical protein [Candidatus Acidoferrales bacterium]
MSDTFRTTPPGQPWSESNTAGNGYQGAFGNEPQGESENEVGKALLVGLLGGLVSAAGYLVYRRLPEEQKERLHAQVRATVAQRITELRENFNI